MSDYIRVKISEDNWFPMYNITEEKKGVVVISQENKKEYDNLMKKIDDMQGFLMDLYNKQEEIKGKERNHCDSF